MPLATVHLVALSSSAKIPNFLRALEASSVQPLVVSRAIRWIIKPEQLSVSPLLNTSWDLLIILPASTQLPEAYLTRDWLSAHWSITAGVPSALLKDFATKNDRILHPKKDDVPELTGAVDKPRMASSNQGLELNKELLEWSRGFKLGQNGAVSMLNLLKFKDSPEAHKNYQTYGKAFAESIGSRRGGNAKIVGKVVKQGTEGQGEDVEGWDEIALAHYPSIHHFVDMLASEDYQKVNHEFRLPSLYDTCILCTSELAPELELGKEAKL